MNESPVCTIEGCARRLLARGLCTRHYRAWSKYGDPLRNPRTDEERFMAKVHKSGDCWLWIGHLSGVGYGMFRYGGITELAHRAAYKLFIGPIPAGFVVDHLCRTRCCVKPAHLEAVTLMENVRRGDHSHLGRGNREKTHCPKGHPYDEANTYTSSAGKRHCKMCSRSRDRSERVLIRALRERIKELERLLTAHGVATPSIHALD